MEDGIRQPVAGCGYPRELVNVESEGILLGGDIREDHERMVRFRSIRRSRSEHTL